MKTIQVTIDEPLLLRLDDHVRCARVPRAMFIRAAVERELERVETEEHVRTYLESYARAVPEGDQGEWPDIEWPASSRDWDDL